MIRDPGYWKRDLLNRAFFLNEKILQRRWRTSSLLKLEQEIMLGFYSIRKLNEARAIKKGKFNQSVELYKFSSKGIKIDYSNCVHIFDHYVNKSQKTTRSLSYITNQIIHSFIFSPCFSISNKKEILGILFNSDRSKNDEVYFIHIKKIAELFADISDGFLPIRGKLKICDGIFYEILD